MYRLQQLDTPFASLVTSVKKAVVTCEDFSTWSISLLTALKARSPHNEKVENAIVNIQDSSSEDKIFTYLQPFFDPIDVRLIENLIELLVEDSQVDQVCRLQMQFPSFIFRISRLSLIYLPITTLYAIHPMELNHPVHACMHD